MRLCGEGHPRPAGFTLIEALISIALASVVLIGLMTYFGFTLQSFTHQEEALTGSRDAQLLLSHLRADISAADGLDVSATASTGTTFPKSQVHLMHAEGSDKVPTYIHTRKDEPSLMPGQDPIKDVFTPLARTSAWLALLKIPRDDPLFDNLPPGTPTNDLLRSLNYAMNAFAWTRSSDPDRERIFSLNVRDGQGTAPVFYRYLPKERYVERIGPQGRTILAFRTLDGFHASPHYEFILFPGQPGATAELVKVWVEVAFSLLSPGVGGKIEKRRLTFSTRVTPRFLNLVIKSRWGL